MLSLHIQSTQQWATEHKTQPQMYSAAVFLCVVYRVTSGFTVTVSHNLRKSARRCSGCTIRLLELCKAFGVQTENTKSQSDCGYDQIRLYELTLPCRSIQTVLRCDLRSTAGHERIWSRHHRLLLGWQQSPYSVGTPRQSRIYWTAVREKEIMIPTGKITGISKLV